MRGKLIAVAACAAAALPATAIAATVSPAPSQKAAVVKAFGDPRSASSCLVVRLAASNRNYATVRFRRVNRCRRWAFNGRNALKRVRDDRSKVVFEGSSYRCPLARIPGACSESSTSAADCGPRGRVTPTIRSLQTRSGRDPRLYSPALRGCSSVG